MKLILFTDGTDHYVIGYGKQDTSITKAPKSILKKIIRAHCFEVVKPTSRPNDIRSFIKLKKEYETYCNLIENQTVWKKNGLTFYSLILCTRENELLQFYGDRWSMKILELRELFDQLRERNKYGVGCEYNRYELQLYIDDFRFGYDINDIEGNILTYPFLMNEFQAEMNKLEKEVDALVKKGYK